MIGIRYVIGKYITSYNILIWAIIEDGTVKESQYGKEQQWHKYNNDDLYFKLHKNIIEIIYNGKYYSYKNPVQEFTSHIFYFNDDNVHLNSENVVNFIEYEKFPFTKNSIIRFQNNSSKTNDNSYYFVNKWVLQYTFHNIYKILDKYYLSDQIEITILDNQNILFFQ